METSQFNEFKQFMKMLFCTQLWMELKLYEVREGSLQLRHIKTKLTAPYYNSIKEVLDDIENWSRGVICETKHEQSMIKLLQERINFELQELKYNG